jgi:predicted N-acetyltransferase YhbS
MEIRLEERTDFKEVEFLNREAFWNVYRPGCYEHLIIHNLRHDPSFIKELDYVLEEDGKIIGHIAFSKNKMCNNDKKCDVVTLGPLCVHPDYQKQGYGTKLINHAFKAIEEMDIPFVFCIGDENYYKRFGFEDASDKGVQYNDMKEDTPFFMVKIFDDNKANFSNAVYKNNPVFDVDEEELEAFDSNFPEKEKEEKEDQLNF